MIGAERWKVSRKKSQAPKSNSNKTPNPKPQPYQIAPFGAWGLVLGASLELGAWDLEFLSSFSQRTGQSAFPTLRSVPGALGQVFRLGAGTTREAKGGQRQKQEEHRA